MTSDVKHKEWLYIHQQIVFAPVVRIPIVSTISFYQRSWLLTSWVFIMSLQTNALLNPFISAMLKFNMVS